MDSMQMVEYLGSKLSERSMVVFSLAPKLRVLYRPNTVEVAVGTFVPKSIWNLSHAYSRAVGVEITWKVHCTFREVGMEVNLVVINIL